MKIFLDDVRNPSDCLKYMHTRIGSLNMIYNEDGWFIVKNYHNFVKIVSKYIDEITHVSFDHDLADGHYHESMDNQEDYEKHLQSVSEKTGRECAEWMRDFYKDKQKKLPVMFVHSMNPVGVQRIINVFKNG